MSGKNNNAKRCTVRIFSGINYKRIILGEGRLVFLFFKKLKKNISAGDPAAQPDAFRAPPPRDPGPQEQEAAGQDKVLQDPGGAEHCPCKLTKYRHGRINVRTLNNPPDS